MPEGGRLTIETARASLAEMAPDPREYVRIAVTDSGSGMSADTSTRAFEPFFTTKQTGEGTGLGLAQVYGFIKQSGGHCRLDSEPGRGTTVILYLASAYQHEKR
jgi:signal transduction histidine kinase